jgi:hypothetical protein
MNDVRRPFEPQLAMCQAKNEELLTNKIQVLGRWEEHFKERLSEGSKSEQPIRPVDLRDDGVDIDLPSSEKIERAPKYLKNNKAAKLLKNDGPNLVNALHEVIQQTWTSRTLPRSWTEGISCPVYKKGELSRDLPLERDMQSLHQNSIGLPLTPCQRGRSALPGWVPIR